MRSLNQYVKTLIKSKVISQKIAANVLDKYHKNLNTISILNVFWGKVYSIIIYTFIPFGLICLQQILFEKLSHMLFIAMFITFLSTTLFLFSLNLMAAHIFKEVQRIQTFSFSLLNSLKQKSNAKLKLKVMINCLIEFLVISLFF